MLHAPMLHALVLSRVLLMDGSVRGVGKAGGAKAHP